MRSRSEDRTRHPGVWTALRAAVALTVLLALPRPARATPMTFQLDVRDALASVDRYNAFLVSLGKSAKGVKLIPGGTTFAGQSCAAFGTVFQLGSVSVLRGTAALASRVPSKDGKSAAALAAVFTTAGVQSWTLPATNAETDIPFWSGAPAADGVAFTAEGVTNDSDSGLLGPDVAPGILRFRADVGAADANGRYRFLVEIFGRTSSNDGALVAKGERRCFTFVDVAPVDLSILNQLVDANVSDPNLNAGLKARVTNIQAALDRRDIQGALDTLAVFSSSVISRLTSLDPSPTIANAKARLLTEAAFRVRRGILFTPASAQCGNGVRETGEACDGTDLGGFNCTTLGFKAGTLACDATCRLDSSGCVAQSVCGNGILEAGEECDNGSANSNTVPDACRTNCVRAFCGDGVIDSFEDCEGKNLKGETCIDLGYDGGSLKCDPEECAFDDENCTIQGE